jgi:hypothetical protein
LRRSEDGKKKSRKKERIERQRLEVDDEKIVMKTFVARRSLVLELELSAAPSTLPGCCCRGMREREKEWESVVLRNI